MNTYLAIKWLHILSSLLLVGTGFGSAFYLFCANRFGDTRAKMFVGQFVVLADWIFTTPTVVLQPLTGWWLMRQAGWSFENSWLRMAVMLYVFAGACWLPVVWLQIRMHRQARQAVATQSSLGKTYQRSAHAWEALGYLGFASVMTILWLMVAKPDLNL